MSDPHIPSTPPDHDYKYGRRNSGRAQLDNIQDPYKRSAKPAEPSVCPQCGAVYHAGRWQWLERPAAAEELLCQACHRINDHYPAGILTLTGPFVAAHRDEMIRLARNKEEAERTDHPLNRIMGIEEEAPDRLVISTTDIHLPHRIAEGMTRAFHGTFSEHFEEDGYFVRVNWHRDQ